MVEASARQAGERALQVAAPPSTCGRGLQSLAGLRGCTGGSVQGAPGPRSASPTGAWAPGVLTGAALLQRKRVWPVLGLSALWGSTQGGLPPLGPRALTAAPRPGLPPSLCWQTPLLCPLPPLTSGSAVLPPVLRGVALACHTDPLSLAFSCFPWCPVTVGNWTAGLAQAGAMGGRSWVWKGAAHAGSRAERQPGWGCLGPQRFYSGVTWGRAGLWSWEPVPASLSLTVFRRQVVDRTRSHLGWYRGLAVREGLPPTRTPRLQPPPLITWASFRGLPTAEPADGAGAQDDPSSPSQWGYRPGRGGRRPGGWP